VKPAKLEHVEVDDGVEAAQAKARTTRAWVVKAGRSRAS
jgi:hypothetical protein